MNKTNEHVTTKYSISNGKIQKATDCVVPPQNANKCPLKSMTLPSVVLPDGYTLEPHNVTKQKRLMCHLVALEFPKASHTRKEQKYPQSFIDPSLCLNSYERDSRGTLEYNVRAGSHTTHNNGLSYAQKLLNSSNTWIRGHMTRSKHSKLSQDASENNGTSTYQKKASESHTQRSTRSIAQDDSIRGKQKGLMCRLIMLDFPEKK